MVKAAVPRERTIHTAHSGPEHKGALSVSSDRMEKERRPQDGSLGFFSGVCSPSWLGV